MRNNSVENRYIESVDSSSIPEQGLGAEDVVVDFFRAFPNLDIRYATPLEDSGLKQIVQDKQLDAIVYREGHPAMGLQISTTASSKVKSEKLRQIQERPFVRLDEMKASDMAIPRALIFLDAGEVKGYRSDHDFDKHPKLKNQILDGAINSLRFDISQTKNPSEKAALESLILMLEQEQKKVSLN